MASLFRAILHAECPVDQDKEHFWVIGLTTSKTIKYIELVGLGTLNAALVAPREVYRLAITQAVDSIIACHNHPSGNTAPSASDLALTDQIMKAGKVVGIEMVDHVIIAGNTHISLMKISVPGDPGKETSETSQARPKKPKTAREQVRLNKKEEEWKVNTCLLATQAMTAIIDAYEAKKQLRAFDEAGKTDREGRCSLVRDLKRQRNAATEKLELLKRTMEGPEE